MQWIFIYNEHLLMNKVNEIKIVFAILKSYKQQLKCEARSQTTWVSEAKSFHCFENGKFNTSVNGF